MKKDYQSMTQTFPSKHYEISVGDIIEIVMAWENDRPLVPWTMNRIYDKLVGMKEGDTITLTPEFPTDEHYGVKSDD
jgi:hypothetical protein